MVLIQKSRITLYCFACYCIVGLRDGKVDSKVVKSFHKSKMLIPGCHVTLGNIIGQGN